LTAARAEAFVEAARRGLDYLPGEVVVKFRSGMGAASVQRALDAVSSRPNADGLEWHSRRRSSARCVATRRASARRATLGAA
jgi:hypothetical protein